MEKFYNDLSLWKSEVKTIKKCKIFNISLIIAHFSKFFSYRASYLFVQYTVNLMVFLYLTAFRIVLQTPPSPKMSFITLHGPIFWEKNLVYTTILKSRKARLYPEFFWKHFYLKWSLVFLSISMFMYFLKKSWIFKASYSESNIVMTISGV